ncbi:MAG TPA: SCO family protein [Caulobacteraceae bacterium]|jgi:protein SCO1/2
MKVLLAALLLMLAGPRAFAAQPFDPFGLAKVAPPPNATAPMTGVFRDQQGRPATLAALAHGRPLVVIPVQYLCPNLCGLTLTGLDQAVQRQAKEGFTVVALGIDPREGPAVAAKAVAGLKSPIVALTGPEAASRAVTDALGYRYAWDKALRQYAHISAVAVLRPDGGLARWLPGPQIDPQALTLALGQAAGGAPQPVPESISSRLFLLCYHLIARGGIYDHRIIEAVRIAGGAIVTLLMLLIGWLIARERRRAPS